MTATPTIRQKLKSTAIIHCGGDNFAVTAVAVSGAKFHLLHNFTSRAAAEHMAAKVLAKGSLDERLWDLVGVATGTPAASHLQAKAQPIDPYRNHHRIAA